jgi:hypothetical protein
MCMELWSENLKGRGHSQDLGVDGGKVWTGFIWLRIGTSGRLLCTR